MPTPTEKGRLAAKFMALRLALFEASGFRVTVVRTCRPVAMSGWHVGGSMWRRWGLAEVGDGGACCPAVQLMMRGMRPRTKARTDWHGAWLGRCSFGLPPAGWRGEIRASRCHADPDLAHRCPRFGRGSVAQA